MHGIATVQIEIRFAEFQILARDVHQPRCSVKDTRWIRMSTTSQAQAKACWMQKSSRVEAICIVAAHKQGNTRKRPNDWPDFGSYKGLGQGLDREGEVCRWTAKSQR